MDKDLDAMIKKCHKDTYNYCEKADQDAAANCARDNAAPLVSY